MIKERFFNQFQIKLVMILIMLFDHLTYIPGLIDPNWAVGIHFISRVVAVWFGYTAIEGVFYTHNLKKYLLRLLTAATLMAFGNFIINYLYQNHAVSVSNNIFLTLFLGVLMVTCLQQITSRWLAILSMIIILTVGCLFSEGGLSVLPFMLITYLTYNRPRIRNILYLLLSVCLFLLSFAVYPTIQETVQMLLFNSDFAFILIVPILAHYNGSRGPTTNFSKYFFYIFYPLHLWLITTIIYFLH